MEVYLRNFEPHKRQPQSPVQAQSVLMDEIELLQKELEGQFAIRSALEKATNRPAVANDPTYKSLSQPAEDLVDEISLLELEILCLEKHLLSLYRKSFAKRLSSVLADRAEDQKPDRTVLPSEAPKTGLESKNEEFSRPDISIDSGIFRSHSSLSRISACSFRASPAFEALDAYHSLPLSVFERTQDTTTGEIPVEHNLGETPNRVSEEMIKCISAIYCRLSDPPLPGWGESSLLDSWLDNPPEEDKELSGTFFAMAQIQGLVRDSGKIKSVEDRLHSYRGLIYKLAQVDPGRLRHDERLAFWINVHNALVMHAYLVYGIPKGCLKRVSLVLKAAYNIGGHTISVDTIQSSILGCRLPRPTPWLHSLFFPKKKFKAGDPINTFALKHPEPRLVFALCSGCKSDPIVSAYTAKKVFQELEMAKEDFIQMNIKVHKAHRLLVPKNVESYLKEMGGYGRSGIAQMVEHFLAESMGFKNVRFGKLSKKADWIPHDFTFHFLLSNKLTR